MNPRVVVVTQQMVDEERVRQMAPDGIELVISPSPADARWADLMSQAEYLVGFVDMLVKPELYRIAPRLRLIQLLSAGYDRADIAAARKAGVPLANNGGANAVAVSEHALMFMLALSRKLLGQHANVVAGRWRGPSTPRLHELRGQTLGIVGMGTIGKKTARLAQASACGCIITTSRACPKMSKTRSTCGSGCSASCCATVMCCRCMCP